MITLGSRLPGGNAYTLLPTNRVLTTIVPLGPSRISRASRTPEAHVSTLKPGGSLNFFVGSWSAAVGIGKAGTGAIFMALSLALGRPLAQPGSSAGACCAEAAPTAQSTAHATNERKSFIFVSSIRLLDATLARSIVSAMRRASIGVAVAVRNTPRQALEERRPQI